MHIIYIHTILCVYPSIRVFHTTITTIGVLLCSVLLPGDGEAVDQVTCQVHYPTCYIIIHAWVCWLSAYSYELFTQFLHTHYPVPHITTACLCLIWCIITTHSYLLLPYGVPAATVTVKLLIPMSAISLLAPTVPVVCITHALLVYLPYHQHMVQVCRCLTHGWGFGTTTDVYGDGLNVVVLGLLSRAQYAVEESIA